MESPEGTPGVVHLFLHTILLCNLAAGVGVIFCFMNLPPTLYTETVTPAVQHPGAEDTWPQWPLGCLLRINCEEIRIE